MSKRNNRVPKFERTKGRKDERTKGRKGDRQKGPSLWSKLVNLLVSHPWLTMLVALWAFLFFFYGDTLRVAQQRSFFVFDSLAMDYWLCQPLGWLYVTGRFMLLSCVWPLCGALLIAGMLTLAARLLDYAERMGPRSTVGCTVCLYGLCVLQGPQPLLSARAELDYDVAAVGPGAVCCAGRSKEGYEVCKRPKAR